MNAITVANNESWKLLPHGFQGFPPPHAPWQLPLHSILQLSYGLFQPQEKLWGGGFRSFSGAEGGGEDSLCSHFLEYKSIIIIKANY